MGNLIAASSFDDPRAHVGCPQDPHTVRWSTDRVQLAVRRMRLQGYVLGTEASLRPDPQRQELSAVLVLLTVLLQDLQGLQGIGNVCAPGTVN